MIWRKWECTTDPRARHEASREDPGIADTQQRVDAGAAAQTAPEELELPLAGANVHQVLRAKLCGVCKENESKYKCTHCYLPYCSIKCSTVHKATHRAIDLTPATNLVELPTAAKQTAPRPGTAAAAGFKAPFSSLDNSEELQLLFKKYPRLPSQLDEINAATFPPVRAQEDSTQLQNQMRGGKLFNKGKEYAWNHDRGLQNGVAALRTARGASGKDGEGIREFSRLILRIVSGDDKDDVIRRELAEENARIIAALLNGEI